MVKVDKEAEKRSFRIHLSAMLIGFVVSFFITFLLFNEYRQNKVNKSKEENCSICHVKPN